MSTNVIQFIIKGNSEDAVKAMDKMRAGMKRVAKTSAVIGVAAVTAFALTAKEIIAVGSKVENLQIRLNALLGSTQEGGRAFDEMAKFASTVPFSYDAIMESATALAGVVKGGVDEISQWMPVIADLATVSGLSIQDTTSQMQRMLAGGANAADMFRERGITAMLGFEAGVSISAEETKKRLIEAFEDPASKFRGASAKMATTWDGVLSMIGDKWFTIKKNISDAGIFNYIKSLAIAFDRTLGRSMENAGDAAQQFSNGMISGLNAAMTVIGFLMDMFHGLHVVWKGLEIAFSLVAQHIIGKVQDISNVMKGMVEEFNFLFSTDIDTSGFEAINTMAKEAGKRTKELETELQSLVEQEMPSDKIKRFQEEAAVIFKELETVVEETKKNLATVAPDLTGIDDKYVAEQQTRITDQYNAIVTSLLSEEEAIRISYETKLMDLENYFVMSDMTEAEHKLLVEQLEQEHQDNLASIKNSGIKGSFEFAKAIRNKDAAGALSNASSMMNSFKANNKIIFKIQKALALATAIVSLPTSVQLSYKNGGGYPWGLIPAGIMLAKGMSDISKIRGTTYGAAHGGLTNVPKESTYLLDKGERVLSPNQNKDFTSFINSPESSGGGNGISIENLEVHILENATNADVLLKMSQDEMDELVADKVITSFNRLGKQGIRPDYIEAV